MKIEHSNLEELDFDSHFWGIPILIAIVLMHPTFIDFMYTERYVGNMSKWSKKEITNFVNVIHVIFIISSVSVCFYFNLGIYYFFGSLFGSLILSSLIGNVLLGKSKKTPPKKIKNDRKINSVNRPFSDEDLLTADIDSLSGTDFERLMECFYRDKGYKVERVGGSGDNEVDLILQDKKGYKIAVQCKRWKKNVGNDVVLRLKAGKQVYGCYDAWIVTTSHFTKTAIEIAEPLNIKLINGVQVHDMISRWRKERLKKAK
ncbi:restriction endonuclease [Brevibacillus ruminantium]|uniref:Restriction endonuclease n=1 Tax=Brevibacillus ruminantium TaxID=2950604 RepID=A0ABY4WF86_9BACL|nr:restriction endonuclease [Brevibacillus ruminantium]USG64793.1 restriction endonuclease [Brevibacillus ruminantium]